MSNSMTVVSQRTQHGDDADTSCIVHVCASCRPPGASRDPRQHRPGYIFYQRLRDAVEESPLKGRIEVRTAECLSVCPRPCGFAISRHNAWTYLFGDQQANDTVPDVIECLSVYLDSPNGYMARSERPKSLRGSILGRIPPIKGVG